MQGFEPPFPPAPADATLRLVVDLPDGLYREVKACAALEGQTLREYVGLALIARVAKGRKVNR